MSDCGFGYLLMQILFLYFFVLSFKFTRLLLFPVAFAPLAIIASESFFITLFGFGAGPIGSFTIDTMNSRPIAGMLVIGLILLFLGLLCVFIADVVMGDIILEDGTILGQQHESKEEHPQTVQEPPSAPLERVSRHYAAPDIMHRDVVKEEKIWYCGGWVHRHEVGATAQYSTDNILPAPQYNSRFNYAPSTPTFGGGSTWRNDVFEGSLAQPRKLRTEEYYDIRGFERTRLGGASPYDYPATGRLWEPSRQERALEREIDIFSPTYVFA